MSIYIRTTVSSLDAQRNLSATSRDMSLSFQRLSSGYRINTAADDAAGLAISESMQAQLDSFSVAQRNANDGISMAQTADGAASQVQSILSRMRQLAVQSNNGDLVTSDRTNLNTEFSTLKSEIDRIANVTKFNNTSLLSGSGNTVSFQVGIGTSSANDQIAIKFGGVDSSTLGLSTASVDSTTNSNTAITAVDAAISNLATAREGFGAGMNRLQYAVSNVESTIVNLSAAHSRIKDVDVAEETSKLAREQVLAQAGAAMLAQANQSPQLALTLLRNA